MQCAMKGVSLPFVVLCLLAACRADASLYLLPSLSHLRVDVGDDARLDCYLSTDGQSVVPPGAFSWTDGAGRALSGTDDERISISVSTYGTVSTLRISSVSRDDEGSFTCSYTGLSNVSIMLDVVVDPYFENVSENQAFVEGTDAIVECPAHLGEPRGEMIWFKDNAYIRDDSQFYPENGQLIIQNISMDDAGLYCCRLIIFASIIDTRCIQVVVREQANFAPEIVEPANPILARYEDPLELSCELAIPGQENITYSWSVHTDFEQTHTTRTQNATFFREAKRFLSGDYTCRAENKYGYDRKVNFVEVLAPPLPDECSQGTVSGGEGSTIVLSHCDITSPVQLADLTYQWKKDGEIIDLEKTKYQVNHEGSLTINNAESADSGAYEVVISNDWGRAVHSVRLDITSSPRAMIECTLEVEYNQAGYTCVNVQEMKEQVSQKLMSQICDSSCSHIRIINSVIRCLPEQPQTRGVFTAILVGPRAQQLAAKAIERGQFSFGLTDDLALSVMICDGSCSEPPEVTQPHSSMTAQFAGGVVAAVIMVAVVTIGLIITVILVKYWRGKLTTQVTVTADPEKATPNTTVLNNQRWHYHTTTNTTSS